MSGKNDGRVERRVATVEDLDLRKSAGSKRPTIRGHAAVFDELSADLGGFRERIAPGAFARAIREGHDVRALYNHNPDRVLGRTPKTLRLAEDSVGLRVEIDPPASESNLLELLERGDVSQMSFGFVVRDERWEPGDGGPDIRTVLDLDLFDVSVVTYPAYPQTDAAVRSHAKWLQAHPDLRLWKMRLELERYRSRAASMR